MHCQWEHTVNCDTCLRPRWVTASVYPILYYTLSIYPGITITAAWKNLNEGITEQMQLSAITWLTHIDVWLIHAICAFHHVFTINHCFLYCRKRFYVVVVILIISKLLCAPCVFSNWSVRAFVLSIYLILTNESHIYDIRFVYLIERAFWAFHYVLHMHSKTVSIIKSLFFLRLKLKVQFTVCLSDRS